MNEQYSYVDSSLEFEPAVGYSKLRESCPVHHVAEHDPPFYAVGRFPDVVAALKNPSLWGNRHGPGVFHQESGALGSADEPDHGRHRAVLRDAFIPSAVARMEPSLVAMADELLDQFVPLGEGDFVSSFAFPFPALAIGEMLGVPPGDREMFRDLSGQIVAALTGGDVAAYHRGKEAVGDYVDARLEERAATPDAPNDDVLSSLLAARNGGVLSAMEVRHIGHQLLVAGHETTTSLLGMMMYRLLERPTLMQQLRDDPSLIPVAIEEAIRFDSPVSGLFRTNLQDVMLHDVQLPAKTKVQIVNAAANRDPTQFPDPDEFRLDRPGRELGRHVGFGWGIHYCIGAPLARLEARVAFERIFARMTDIELAGEPERNQSFVLHGLTSLPLRWRPQPRTTP
jgi:cytochrome P450